MSRTIVLIHGAWMTPRCWERFTGYFEGSGYRVLAPAWPGKSRPVEEIRQDPATLAGLGVQEIVDHYAVLIEALPEPPILIGHSFGGLFVQLLLDRGLGEAAVALDPAPPKGILITQPSAVRFNGHVLAKPGNRSKVVHMSYQQFDYAFVHTLAEAEAAVAYDRYVVPETGRIFFQAAFGPLARRSPTTVNFGNNDRAPLLIVAGQKDRCVPAALNRANHRRYRRSTAITDFKEFPGRSHWILAQDGWEEVASHAEWWLSRVGATE